MIFIDVKFEVKNIEFLIEEFVGKGILMVEKVYKKIFWNIIEFGIKDFSGNWIIFLEDL